MSASYQAVMIGVATVIGLLVTGMVPIESARAAAFKTESLIALDKVVGTLRSAGTGSPRRQGRQYAQVGSATVVGDSFTQVANRKGAAEAEKATAWVHCFKAGRLHTSIDDFPPVEYEEAHHCRDNSSPQGYSDTAVA